MKKLVISATITPLLEDGRQCKRAYRNCVGSIERGA